VRIAVVVFPGSNCDHDVYIAYKKILNLPTDFIWHKETNLKGYDLVVLPGGFSYGDYLRCGAIARFSPVMKEVIRLAQQGKKILGICNGFQILTEAGLLPGSLMRNDHRQFRCREVYLRIENTLTPFTHRCEQDAVLGIPIAHSEGNYFCDAQTLSDLQHHKQIVFRYCDRDGRITADANPNGSIFNIAGIINRDGNIMGMMPHPERRAEKLLSHSDGLQILKSTVENLL
jgi:phosphoribosylformylglycinamidine synthase subunit PurQ / glutaminase